MIAVRGPALLLCAALVASACGLAGTMSSVSSMSCENVPSGACQDQATILTAGLSGVSEVIIQCRNAPPCTRAGGAGMAEIRFENGQKISRAWSYTGDPGPPLVTCIGVGKPLCDSYLQPELDGISPTKHVAAVTASCSSSTCTDANGEIKVNIRLADGSEQETTVGWSSGP